MDVLQSKRRVLGGIIFTVIFPLMLMTGCQKKDSPAQAAELPGKRVVVGFQVPATDFEPIDAAQGALGSRVVAEAVYEPLLMSDGMGKVIPWLAESYEVDEQGINWVFHIRKGVTFSNGEPLDADCVVLTMERVMQNYTGPKAVRVRGIFPDNLLESVEKVDDYTVKIKLKFSYSDALNSFTDVFIIPKQAYQERGEALFEDLSPTGYVGTGPWILTNNTIGQSTDYKKNPNYWNKNYNSYYDEMRILFITEQSTAIAACISGDIQVYVPSGGIRRDLLAQFDSVKDKFDVFVTGQKSFYYLQFACDNGKLFNDMKLRQAFWTSIDFQSVLDFVLGGGKALNQWTPDGYLGYDTEMPPYEFNPEKAKQLLAETNYNGEEIGLYSASSTFMSEDQLLAIADYANAVGFNVKVHIIENADLAQRRYAGNYDIFMAPANFADASPTVNIMARVRNDQDAHKINDQQLIDFVDAGAMSFDPEMRAEHYKNAQRRMREIWGPMIGMYYADSYAAINYGVHGIELDVGSQIYLSFIDYDVNNPQRTNHGVDWDNLTKPF